MLDVARVYVRLPEWKLWRDRVMVPYRSGTEGEGICGIFLVSLQKLIRRSSVQLFVRDIFWFLRVPRESAVSGDSRLVQGYDVDTSAS